MALKKLIEIDEKFPVIKKPRLGAPPPADDVLDNVGEPENPKTTAPRPAAQMGDQATITEEMAEEEDRASALARSATPRKRERAPKRQAHPDRSIYGRRYRKTGRTFQFGARVTPEFAEAMRVTAAARNITIGELLDEMRVCYVTLQEAASARSQSVDILLKELHQR